MSMRDRRKAWMGKGVGNAEKRCHLPTTPGGTWNGEHATKGKWAAEDPRAAPRARQERVRNLSPENRSVGIAARTRTNVGMRVAKKGVEAQRAKEWQEWGSHEPLEINEPEKEKNQKDEVTIYGKGVERVREFKYPGRKLTADGLDVEEVKARMAAARGGMAQLMLPLHRRSAASTRTKLAVFRTVSMAQLVYASQTWTLRETEWKKLHALEMRCLRRVLGWRGKMTENGIRYPKNEEVFKEIGKVQGKRYVSVREMVEQRQLKWWGMVLRMSPDSMVKSVLSAKRDGVSRRGLRGAMGLAATLQGRAETAGLGQQDLWVRARWGAPPAASEEQPAQPPKTTANGGAAVAALPPLAPGGGRQRRAERSEKGNGEAKANRQTNK